MKDKIMLISLLIVLSSSLGYALPKIGENIQARRTTQIRTRTRTRTRRTSRSSRANSSKSSFYIINEPKFRVRNVQGTCGARG